MIVVRFASLNRAKNLIFNVVRRVALIAAKHEEMIMNFLQEKKKNSFKNLMVLLYC